MRTITLIYLISSIAIAAYAVPSMISYQGELSDANGPMNGAIVFVFLLFDQESGGAPLWSDTDTLLVDEGLFHAYLGANSPLPGNLFTSSPLWLETQVDGEILTPRQQFVSVPFSLRAARADTADVALHALSADDLLWDTNGTDVFRPSGNVGIGTSTPQFKLSVNGTVNTHGYHLEGNEIIHHVDADTYRLQSHDGSSRIVINDNSVSIPEDLLVSGRVGITQNGYWGDLDLFTGHPSSYPRLYIYETPGGGGERQETALYTNGRLRLRELNATESVTAVTYFGDGSNLTGIAGTTDNDWTISGSDIYRITGEIGVGTSSPDAPLHISSGVVSNQGLLHVNATNAKGTTRAIFAETGSSGSNSTAIFGQQNNSNPNSSGGTFGVFGRILRSAGTIGHSSAAVFGDAIGNGDTNGDGHPEPFDALANGVQGETWSTNNSAAGGRFYAAQVTGQADAVYGQTNSTDAGSYALYGSGPMLVTGTKSAGVMTRSQGPSEMYSVEATEVWFEDFGQGRLEHGKALIGLDPVFLEVVTIDDANPYHVFLQFYDNATMNDCVVIRHDHSFEVLEKNQGRSTASFSFRITAKRKFHEGKRMQPVPLQLDRFLDPGTTNSGAGGHF